MIPAETGIGRVTRLGTGVALLIFPPMLLVGFLLHPDITSLELVTDAQAWAAEFRGNFLFHLGHVLVMFTAPLAIIVGVRCMRFATGRGAWWIFSGGVLGVSGAFILAVDKGALTLVLTAFDTLPIGVRADLSGAPGHARTRRMAVDRLLARAPPARVHHPGRGPRDGWRHRQGPGCSDRCGHGDSLRRRYRDHHCRWAQSSCASAICRWVSASSAESSALLHSGRWRLPPQSPSTPRA